MGLFLKSKKLKILEEINKKSSIKRYINFCIGCLLVAISYNLFFDKLLYLCYYVFGKRTCI